MIRRCGIVPQVSSLTAGAAAEETVQGLVLKNI